MARDPLDRIRSLDHTLMSGIRRPSAAHRPRVVSTDKRPTGWQAPAAGEKTGNKKPNDPAPWFKRFFRLSMWFCVLAFIFAAFSFLRGGTGISARLVDVSIVAPTFADGGTPMTLDVMVQNRNRAPIEDARLIISYAAPRPDEPQALETFERDLGTVAAGQRLTESFDVTLFGPEGTQRQIDARIEFNVTGSRATFTKTENHTVTIRSSPVRLTVQNPAEAVPNQPVTLTIRVAPNTTESLGRTVVRVRTPAGWTFQSADPTPSVGNDTWDLGELPAGEEQVIKLTGTLSGAPGELQTITVAVGKADPNDARGIGVLYQERPVVMELSRSFLDASLFVGEDSSATVSVPPNGGSVTVKYNNPAPTAIDRATITLVFAGPGFDVNGISSPYGFFDSNTKTLTYSFSNMNQLNRINPGGTGEFTFQITPNPQVQGANRYVTISASVSGSISGSEQAVQGIDTMKISVAADARLLTDTFSQTGAIQNTGPIPPRVGQTTQYTLRWRMSGVTSMLKSVTVRTTLPSYVTWTGATVVSTGQSTLVYNPSTREVMWSLGDVAAGSEPVASFQVSLRPSQSQSGSIVPLSGAVSLSGQDASLLTQVSQTRPAHQTTLTGSEVANGSGMVAPAGNGQ